MNHPCMPTYEKAYDTCYGKQTLLLKNAEDYWLFLAKFQKID